MKNIGIIAEFNPFHNGHKLLIDYARNDLNADNIIVIMSGNFVQRGEPAIFDKWSRAKMCLQEGVDIVIELPVIFATASAEFFSIGAISILNNLNCITDIVFGAECSKLELMYSLADLFVNEPKEYKLLLKKLLKEGLSYPIARAKAAEIHLKTEVDILKEPNNILAIEYLKALIKTQSTIKPNILLRKHAQYHEKSIKSSIASATAIRTAIKESEFDKIKQCVPIKAFETITQLINNGTGPCYYDDLSQPLHFKLRTSDISEIANIMDINEGLENRIIHYAKREFLISDLTAAIKSKRYTHSKIQRSLLHIILDISKDYFNSYKNNPKYIRILGIKRNSKIIKEITSKSQLPVITNTLKNAKTLTTDSLSLLKLDFRATDIYTLLYQNKKLNSAKQDITTPLIVT